MSGQQVIAESTCLFGDFVVTGYVPLDGTPIVYSLHHGGHHHGMGDRAAMLDLVNRIETPVMIQHGACPEHAMELAELQAAGARYTARFIEDAYVATSERECDRCGAVANYEWSTRLDQPQEAACTDAMVRIDRNLIAYQDAGCISL